MPSMRAEVIIPARYASTRLPGKPLLARTGKPLIQHVVENVSLARPAGTPTGCTVATDDRRIARAVEAFGGKWVMTRTDHATGTDRVGEAAESLGLADDDIVVNVQGDEPEMDPGNIDRLVRLVEVSGADMATLAAPLGAEGAANPNSVKVVLSAGDCPELRPPVGGYAMYFSRAAIPFDRDARGGARYLLHLGIYAYRKKALLAYAALPPTPAEQAEKLEQLRALEHGWRIAVGVVESAPAGIDTMEDYEAFVRRTQARSTHSGKDRT